MSKIKRYDFILYDGFDRQKILFPGLCDEVPESSEGEYVLYEDVRKYIELDTELPTLAKAIAEHPWSKLLFKLADLCPDEVSDELE